MLLALREGVGATQLRFNSTRTGARKQASVQLRSLEQIRDATPRRHFRLLTSGRALDAIVTSEELFAMEALQGQPLVDVGNWVAG